MATEQEILDILEHAGVKGMKWGVRRAQPEGPGRYQRRANEALARQGGSKKKAITATVGRTIAVGLLARVGTNLAVKALPLDPMTVRGLRFAETVLQVGNLAIGARDTYMLARTQQEQTN